MNINNIIITQLMPQIFYNKLLFFRISFLKSYKHDNRVIKATKTTFYYDGIEKNFLFFIQMIADRTALTKIK